MVTRRKKPAEAEASGPPAEAVAPVPTPEGEGVLAPKKKRSHKKKTVAPHEDAAGVAIPLQPHPEIPSAPKFGAPASIMPVNMKIEAVPTTEEAERPWRPLKKEDSLVVPPKVLQAPRVYPKLDVEDILEEPERARPSSYNPAHDFVRPPVRAGVFRKVGMGFALVALAVLVFVGYVTYAHVTVIIHSKPETVNIQRVVAVATDPGEGEVGGQILEVTVAGEKSGVTGAANADSAAPAPAPTASDANATYVGTVTLHNETSAAVTLVPTTRLLTPDGVLFRMKDRATIPAGGTIRAAVYSDKPGSTGAVGPSDFTIPGLPADKQEVIYAKSDAAMVAGDRTSVVVTTAPSASAPEVTAENIAAVETVLHDELVAQAEGELKKGETGDWTGQAYLVETMSRFVSAAPGERADRITVRLTLRVRKVRFDREKAIATAQADLKRELTSDRELTNVKSSADDAVEEADPKTGKASVRLTLSGDSTLPLNSPLFDAEKLRGLDIGAVQAYFGNIKGVERVDIIFVPPWPKRMPDLKDHIKFEIQP